MRIIMRICLITGIFPPDIGGPATYVSRLARELSQHGHDVCVITLGSDRTTYPFPVFRISRKYPWPVRLVLLFFIMLRYGWRGDIWYVNGLELPAVVAGKLLRKPLFMKVVGDYAWERAMNKALTDDDIDTFQHTRQPWIVELHKAVRAWCARQVVSVITPSQYLKSIVRGWGVSEARIQVIYNAVEPIPEDIDAPSKVRTQLGFSENDRLVLTSARLVSWKGIDSLIQSMTALDESVKLLVVGDGPEKNKLTDFAVRLNVAHRVFFCGKLKRCQALAYIKAADVFVLNTQYEGFSHVLLEAMTVGTPVITTPVCGNPELVAHGQNGLLVEQGNSDLLAAGITSVLENAALRKQLIEGGKRSVQQYSWEPLIRQTTEVLGGIDVERG